MLVDFREVSRLSTFTTLIICLVALSMAVYVQYWAQNPGLPSFHLLKIQTTKQNMMINKFVVPEHA